MSWDVFVLNLPPGIKSLDDIPKDYVPPPLGTRADIIAKIKAIYPQTDFSDPSWGTLQLPECWIEFALGSEEQVTSFSMLVRGGEHAQESVAHILDTLGMHAIDPDSKTGIFADEDDLRESFARWGGFRSHVDKTINGGR
jgi:hypothetical protein